VSGRITLALLAIAPAVLAYPWASPRDYWLLVLAATAVIVLFGRWRGMSFTTLLRRRASLVGRRGRIDAGGVSPVTTTALLRVGAPGDDPHALPLTLVAGYLDRYGIRADKIRVTLRDGISGPTGTTPREAWIALTVCAIDNLTALRARSSRIPLHETAEVAARRLADHLRELGWDAVAVGPDDVPRLLTPDARETWRGVRCGDSDYVAVYRVRVDDGLSDTLAEIRNHPARESWVALEITGERARPTMAAACAFRTDTPPAPAAPVDGLTPQLGNQGRALAALSLTSTRRLDGQVRT
jgi:hypothetical protein